MLETPLLGKTTLKQAEDVRGTFLKRLEVWYTYFNIILQPMIERVAIDVQNECQDAGITLPDAFPQRETVADSAGPSEKSARDAKGLLPLRDVEGKSEAWLEIYALSIPLPSTYDARILSKKEMEVAALRERQFRESEANDALNDLRTHLITTEAIKMRGFSANRKASSARTREKIAHTHGDVDFAANRYRRARLALLALGVSPDAPMFKPLLAADKKAFHLGSSRETLGSSREDTSWIWDSLTFANERSDIRFEQFFSEGKRDRTMPRQSMLITIAQSDVYTGFAQEHYFRAGRRKPSCFRRR